MQTIRITTSQNIDIDYEIGGLGERILARLIDYAIYALIAVATIIIAFISGLNNSNIGLGIAGVIYAVLYVFYDLACETFMNGQSVGKRFMKIKVISLDGRRPNFGQYLLRWMFRIVDFVITLGGCALITAILSKKCQRLGDIVAGTTLIKTESRTNTGNIAFAPPAVGYTSIFPEASQLKDKDIILIHEVIAAYTKSGNAVIIYNTATHLKTLLAITTPAEMNDLQFLQTLVKDYNYIAAGAETA